MPTLLIQHCEQSPPGKLLDVLQTFGHSIHRVRTDHGDALPSSLENYNGIVSIGGPQSARDPDEAMLAECALLKRAHEKGVPILGICLGFQLLAVALGGEVKRLNGGPEVGFINVELTRAGWEDPLFKGLPWCTRQFHWHEDEVSIPPPGAEILAKSERSSVQAFVLGTRTYGVQYHPEYKREDIVEHWKRTDRFAESGGGQAMLERQTDLYLDEFERHATRFFECAALFLLAPKGSRKP